MKRIYFLFAALVFFYTGVVFSAESKIRQFKGSGEVTSVDPVYSRVTIQYGAIKGFAGDGETEFEVSSPGLLKDIHTRDLVDFEMTENHGDLKIEKITKTGEAPPHEEGTPVGKAVQDVLVGTGQVVKGVTEPITPVHDTVGEAVGGTTEAVGDAVSGANPDVKNKF